MYHMSKTFQVDIYDWGEKLLASVFVQADTRHDAMMDALEHSGIHQHLWDSVSMHIEEV